ncbi:MAG: DegQ family serine endoprotease [Pyrinomonadaceae bacterium]|nr:DegQ family serine endoprotease [Pyrinomonadaceae bacterium]
MKMNSGSRFRNATLRASLFVMVFSIIAGVSLAIGLNARYARASATSTIPTPDALTTGNTDLARNSYAPVVSRVSPAVVTIRSESRVQAAQESPSFDDPQLREFFGGRIPQQQQGPQRRSGLGSGVIVSSDGTILTNHHVIEGAEKIKVQLTDNRTFDAKLVGSDAASDLAVLKVESSGLPVLPLGDSDDVRVGDVALAVGNPLGVGQTVTSGIISAKGRATGLSDGSFEDFLQTDAPINQGNSGGALVNTNGELIGINSQILSPSGGNIGIGFAIPSNMAKNVMDQLVTSGKVRRGVLGLTVQAVTSDIAASLGLKDTNAVIVSSVQPGSSAERAGLKQGDVITRFNGAAVVDTNSFRNRVASTQPNTSIALTVLRDGREQEVRATLGERASGNSGTNGEASGGDATGGKLGVSVGPLTAELAAELRLAADTKGLVVRDLDPEGAAAEAGVERGDVIVEFNRRAVSSIEQLRAAMEGANGGPVLMLINRRGNSLYVTVRLRS